MAFSPSPAYAGGDTIPKGRAEQALQQSVMDVGRRLKWRTVTTGSPGYWVFSFPEREVVKKVAGAMNGAVTLSPDATQIAFFDTHYPPLQNLGRAMDLVIEDLETGARQSTGLMAREPSLLAWSPDEGRLALFAKEAITDPNATWPQESLKTLIEGPRKPFKLFIFAIQNKTLELYDLPDIWNDDSLLKSSIFSDQIWSPDGNELLYTVTLDSKPPFRTEIHMFSLTTKTTRFLIQGDSPTWSPTSNRIAFRGSDGNYYLINADGSGQELLLKVKKNFPDIVGPLLWSPDGRWLLVARWSSTPKELVDLFVMDPATRAMVRVEKESDGYFSWRGRRDD